MLSVILVNVLLPCKIFKSFASNFTTTFLSEKYTLIVASTVLLVVLVVIAKFASKKIAKNQTEDRVYKYSIPISNYAYLGYVLIENVFGQLFLTSFIFFAIPFIFYTYTFGYAILTKKSSNVKNLFNTITFAIILGVIVGLTNLEIPAFLSNIISSASSCVGPLSMIMTGIIISTFSLKRLITNPNSYLFLFLKMNKIYLPL